VLPSGLTIERPTERLLRFCAEEFEYYDGIPSDAPERVTPVDVLVTISVNSFINNATRVRSVHRALAESCDPLLARLPTTATLLDADAPIQQVCDLLHAAVQAPNVLLSSVTKVLHRKRPALIPMLDNVVLGYYMRSLGQARLWSKTQDKRHAAAVGQTVLNAFRADLLATQDSLERLRGEIAHHGYPLTLVRVLEILVWTEVEERGYYRQAVAS
jgi:Family of unknown function (DUF6308)